MLLAQGEAFSALQSRAAASSAWGVLGCAARDGAERSLKGRALLALGDCDAAIAEFKAAREVFVALGADPPSPS